MCLTPVPRAATFYPTTEPQRLPLSTATHVPPATTITQAHARRNPYLGMTRLFNVRDSYSAVVWDEQKRSDIRSLVRPVFHTAAEGTFTSCIPAQVQPLPSRVTAHAFHEVAVPARMDTYLLRRDRFFKAMRFAFLLEEADPSLRNFVVRELTWLYH